MKAGWMLLGLAAFAGCDSDSASEPLVNRCREDFECAPSETCDETLSACVRESAEQSYPYVVQVSTNGNGKGLVPRTLTARQVLRESPVLNDIQIRRSVNVSGQVRGFLGDGGASDAGAELTAIEAELALSPKDAAVYLTPTLSVFTRYASATQSQWFTALLDPSTTYEVRVLPLGRNASDKLPPHSFDIGVGNSPQRVEHEYPTLYPLTGALLPEALPPIGAPSPLAGLRVRLQEKGTKKVVSSVTSLGVHGEYTLFVERAVRENLAIHELVLDILREGPPWIATLGVPGSLLGPDRTITIPNIPPLTPLRVVIAPLGEPPSADVTFVSNFQPPLDAEVAPVRDWCRLRTQSANTFNCQAEFRSVLPGDEAGLVVSLFPGYYEIFARPSGNVAGGPRLATTRQVEDVRPPTPPATIQGPSAITFDAAKEYEGEVLSTQGKRMPQVTVTANALNLADPTLGELTAYNRTSQSVSEGDGSYELAVDTGSYDLVAAAPEGTGFPWFCSPNRFLSENDPANVNITLSSPVIARGRVVDEQNNPVFPARVEAFAIVEDESGERAVRIARSESNDAGLFELFMPSRIEDGRRTQFTSMDGGVGIDAAVRIQPLSDSAPSGSGTSPRPSGAAP